MGVKVRERPKDSDIWWVFIDHRGRRAAKKVGDHEEAEKVKRIIEGRLALGETPFGDKPTKKAPTLAVYYRNFKRTYVDIALKHRTQQIYRNSFERHILPALGQL
jgi:integrase